MNEFFVELYSEEIPPNLQINVRKEFEDRIRNSLIDENIKFKKIFSYSSPTRLVIHVIGVVDKIKISSKVIKGPKVGVIEDILNNFLRSNNASKKALFKKKIDKGEFYFIKTLPKELFAKDLLIKIILNIISSFKWKKSMKWSNHSMIWGRPLRSILAIYNNNHLSFNFGHLRSTENAIIEKDLLVKTKKVKNFKDYENFLKKNNVFFNQKEREQKIIKKLEQICKSRNYNNVFNNRLIEEVTNIVEDPNVLLLEFDKKYLEIPPEIIISTLELHQKYFPLFDNKNKLTNNFCVVANKPDTNNIIKDGNQRVVEARLSDAKFFWDKDKSRNLIKQLANLKKITFYEKLGSIYDKTQRLRKLSSWLSDEININKEKVEIAASISKSDLCSDLVNEYPELQGKMGKYFALAQGFDEEVANAVSDHYLPIGNASIVAKKPISYSISLVDKLDTLVGFFLINQKPTSSKDPLALRRSAIGLLKTIIENKINIKLSDLINYNVKLFQEQKVNIENIDVEKEIIKFLRDRIKNILKEKNIKGDIIDASISSHANSNFLDLYKKNIIMNKYINKDIGKNVLSSYKRAFNIVGKSADNIDGSPDAVLFRQDEEKKLFEKIKEIRKNITIKENNKDFEKLLISLSETRLLTDSFFDKVKVNDENIDIKNNRLQLLKLFCNTFNNFINFSKLEGVS